MWHPPATWAAGTILTAAQLNAEVRDQQKAISDPWEPYTPDWTAAGSPCNIVDGTIEGGVWDIGSLLGFYLRIVMGPNTAFGTGTYSITLPKAAASVVRWSFDGCARDVSAPGFYRLTTVQNGLTLNLFCDGTTAGGPLRSVTNTAPFTFAPGDEIHLHGFGMSA